MPDRKSLVFMLWITSLLALLASVMIVPLRTSGLATVSSRAESVRRNFDLPPGQPATLVGAMTATDAVQQGNALLAEFEEQDRTDALDEPRVCFLVPCSIRKVPDRQLVAPRSILSLYPLRC